MFSEQLLEEGFSRQTTYNGYGLPPLPPTNPYVSQGPSNQFAGLNSRPPSGSSLKARSASVLSTPRRDMVTFPAKNISFSVNLDI